MTLDFNIAIVSMVVITGIGWLLRRYAKISICPICAGVAGTWLWLLVARAFGSAVDPVTLGLLLGASVVGIAYQLEKRLPPGQSPLLWKALFIPVGLGAAHSVVVEHWITALALVAAMVGLGMYFAAKRETHNPLLESGEVQRIEKSLEKCC